jgi:phosphonate transport system substrate-binding protein
MVKALLDFWRTCFIVMGILLLPQLLWANGIYLGSISSTPAQEIKKFLPLAVYLGRELQSKGIVQGKVVVARNIAEMSDLLREGKVDLYIDSVYPSLAVSRLSGSKLILRRWKKGISEYHSVIFVRKDSDISRLEDLKGKIIAFEEPFSSSGYFIPKMVLMQEGLKLVAKTNSSEPVGPDEIGYLFSLDDENTLVWVVRGKVMAGAIDNQNYEKMAKQNHDSLKVIYRTFSFPRHIVSHRADLPSKLVARIKEILTQMDRSEAGRKALQDFERTTKFDDLSEQAKANLLRADKYIDLELGLK